MRLSRNTLRSESVSSLPSNFVYACLPAFVCGVRRAAHTGLKGAIIEALWAPRDGLNGEDNRRCLISVSWGSVCG